MSLQRSKRGAVDISVFGVKTPKGYVEVITTAEERRFFQRSKRYKGFFLVELFPPAVPEQVAGRPKEAVERLKTLTDKYAWIDEMAELESMLSDPRNGR